MGRNDIEGLQCRRRLRRKQVQEGRNRASPARLVKLNKSLVREQKDMIESYSLEGLLKIEASTMRADLSRWVLQRYNPDNESIVVPGRGEIHVTTESVHQTLGLRNSGEEVFYGWDAEAISFSNNKYGFESGMAPQITTFYNLIKGMNGRADDDFMREWLIVVVSCFICPTTSLNVSPQCYPIVADLERVKRLNLCSFTAKQIISSFCKTTRKKAVNCCVHHMVNKRKIAAMLSTLCSEILDKMGSFVEVISKLDKNDAGSSGSFLHKSKHRKDASHQGKKAEEYVHDRGTPEDDAEYLPSSESDEGE
ncbi:hypothetical protein D1007_53577 [Hordeum vulgare]|nr:hypothetical protein D1007_53577 [Hordeum vulgare]